MPPNINTGGVEAGVATDTVPKSRRINTTAPLAGGGDLSADRTLTIDTSGFANVYTSTINIFTHLNQFRRAIYGGGTTVSATRYVVSGELAGIVVGSGITTLNGLTAATQTFATDGAGTDFAVASAGSAHTWSLPDAGKFARGALTAGTQTVSGQKMFVGIVSVSGNLFCTANLSVARGGASGQTFYSTPFAGWRYILYGSGTLGGPVVFQTLDPRDRVEFSAIPVVLTSSDLQVSGIAVVYDRLLLGDTNRDYQRLWGFNGDPDTGYSWELVGSGKVTGDVVAFRRADSQWTFQTPVQVQSPYSTRLEGTVQVSGALTAYKTVAVGRTEANVGQIFYGIGDSASGAGWILCGSGEVRGDVLFSALGPKHRLVVSLPLRVSNVNPYTTNSVTFLVDTQVSGVTRLYGPIGAGPYADSVQVGDAVPLSYQWLYGGVPDTAGYSHYLVGSGQLAGMTRFTKAAGVRPERVEFNAIDAVFGSSMAAPKVVVSAVGDVQVSGVTIAYRPIHQGDQTSAAQRYVTSGELAAGGGVSAASSVYWTGAKHVYAAGTTVVVSGVLGVGVKPVVAASDTAQGQALYGTSPNADGNSWVLVGSGDITGRVRLDKQFAGDTVSVNLPLLATDRSQFGLIGGEAALAISATGDVQVSGQILAYRDLTLHSGNVSATNVSTAGTYGFTAYQIENTSTFARLSALKGHGTLTTPTAINAAEDSLGELRFGGHDGSAWQTQTSVRAYAAAPWTTTRRGAHLAFLTTASGSTALVEQLRIDHAGRVGIGTGSPATTLHVAGPTLIAGNLQISGQLLTPTVALSYVPWFHGDTSAGNRYLVSGELSAAGTGNVSSATSVYWTGAKHVYAVGTTIVVSGLFGVGVKPVLGAGAADGQAFYGTAGDVDGNRWTLVGSGDITGGVRVDKQHAGDVVTLNLPLVATDRSQFGLLGGETAVAISATGDVQLSGVTIAYRRMGVGVEPQLTGFPPAQGQAFYGTQADADGNRWRLYGSGIVAGTTTFQALAAEDSMRFSLPVVLDTGGLQVSGGVTLAYAPIYQGDQTAAAQRYVVSGEITTGPFYRAASAEWWSNTAAEQLVYSAPVPANTFSVGRGLRAHLSGRFLSPGSVSLRTILTLGDNVLVSGSVGLTGTPEVRNWAMNYTLVGVTSAQQVLDGSVFYGGNLTASGTPNTGSAIFFGQAYASVDATTSQVLTHRMSLSSSPTISGTWDAVQIDVI